MFTLCSLEIFWSVHLTAALYNPYVLSPSTAPLHDPNTVSRLACYHLNLHLHDHTVTPNPTASTNSI